MDALETLVAKFIRFFAKAIRTVRMYNIAHPSMKRELDQAIESLEQILKDVEEFSLGFQEQTFTLQNSPSKALSSTALPLYPMLHGKRIATIVFGRQMSRDEFTALVDLLSKKDDKVLKGNRIDPSFLTPFHHIKLKELVFVLVDSGQAVPTGPMVAASAASAVPADPSAAATPPAGPPVPQDFLTVLERHFQAALSTLETRIPQVEPERRAAEAEAEILRYMTAFAQATQKEGKVPSDLLTLGYLEKLFAKGFAGEGIGRLREILGRLLGRLASDERAVFAGSTAPAASPADEVMAIVRRLSPEFRSSMVTADVAAGHLAVEDVKESIEALALSPREFMELMEVVSKVLVRTGGSAGDAKSQLDKVMNLLPMMEQVQTIRGSIVIIDPDPAQVTMYQEALWEAGFTILPFGDAEAALEAVETKDDVDAIVMEMRLPGLQGAELLTALQEKGRAVPVIVVTENPRFKDDFEVVTYPKLKFMTKPVEGAQVLAAVKEMAPPRMVRVETRPAASSPEDGPTEAEVRKAKNLQVSLLPKHLPGIDGFEVAAVHRLADGSVSDFYDVVSRGERELGIVLCRLTGGPTAGARVMMMLRNIFRALAEMDAPAVDSVLEANDLIARQVEPGMFVNALYAVLDLGTAKVQVANVGHQPPVVWSRDMGLASTGMSPTAAALGAESKAALAPKIVKESIDLSPGDFAVFLTEGVTEAKSPQHGTFGVKRLIQTVSRNSTCAPAELAQHLVDAVVAHMHGEPQATDLSIVVVRRSG